MKPKSFFEDGWMFDFVSDEMDGWWVMSDGWMRVIDDGGGSWAMDGCMQVIRDRRVL